MKRQHYVWNGLWVNRVAMAALLTVGGTLVPASSTSAQMRIINSQPLRSMYQQARQFVPQIRQQPTYQQQHYHNYRQYHTVPQQSYTHQQPIYSQPSYPQYHQPCCPYTNPPVYVNPPVVVNPPIIVDPGTVVVPPVDPPQPPEIVENPKTKDPIDVIEPPKEVTPWEQWTDMPPLRGDFPAMVHQVAGDLAWLQVAHRDKFSPEVNSLLSEGKNLLDTTCRVCDEETDLFAGLEGGDETVRDVAEQVRQFRDMVGQALQQPEMQEMLTMVEPARKDKSKLGSVIGPLDAAAKQKLFAMFALETLQKRANSLVDAADAVEAGTFQPVDMDTLAQALKVGDAAPDFTLQTVDGETVSLDDYKGKNLVLVFNRGHWCPFCMNQVGQLAAKAGEFDAQDAEVLVVFRELKPNMEVADGIEGLRAYKQKANPDMTLAIDFGANLTSQYSTDGNFTTYVIDKDGQIASVLRGVKYLRPSADAVLASVGEVNSSL